jgi:hypothetical protein
MIHLLLILFTTMQVMLTLQNRSDLTRSQERVFYKLFLDGSEEFTEMDHKRERRFFDVSSFRAFLGASLAVLRYYRVTLLELLQHQ